MANFGCRPERICETGMQILVEIRNAAPDTIVRIKKFQRIVRIKVK